MKGLADLPIRTTWITTLAIFTLLVVGVGGIGVYGNEASRTSFATFDRIHVRQSSALNDAYVAMLRARIEMSRAAQLLERPSFDRPGPALDEAATLLESAARSFEAFAAIDALPEQEASIEALSRGFESFLGTGLRLQLSSLQDGDIDGWRAYRSRVSEMSAAFVESAEAFFTISRAQGEALAAQSNALSRTFDVAIAGAIVACLLLVGFMLWWVTRYVTRPIRGLLERFSRIGAGDLSTPIEPRGRNEIGQLFAGLGELRESLASTVLEVRGSSDVVATHADRVTTGNRELAADTDRQSTALEQTAAHLGALTQTVSDNADHARRASELTLKAEQEAKNASGEMQRMTETMNGIERSSGEVREMIGLIDHIAFQTNVLALNASVEAAHAGPHGRGFSVVAAEIRTLAERSAGAARDVRGLIETSDSRIAEGAGLASRVETIMARVVDSAGEINTVVGDIAAASSVQREGLDELNAAMTEMSQVTAQNRERASVASETAERLDAEAERLRQEVASFTLAAAQGEGAADVSDDIASAPPEPTSLPAPASKRETVPAFEA
ncbi:methyl-accepting chemotaxis protein [Salinicola halophilus]|uniref:methyl-accepting chemotaxis protein n=1 Tax=Salinicola halophilus TaxID=184065 RepID=UPI000DA11485|nr:methyl-accepting chemotaxis protein [Salinicola halophilus]